MVQARNLWQLLQMTRDRSTLMRACGVAEQVLTDGSDYDRFDAYAACMPLCRGHEIIESDAALIEALLGVRAPICPESAPDLWHAAAYALCYAAAVCSVLPLGFAYSLLRALPIQIDYSQIFHGDLLSF